MPTYILHVDDHLAHEITEDPRRESELGGGDRGTDEQEHHVADRIVHDEEVGDTPHRLVASNDDDDAEVSAQSDHGDDAEENRYDHVSRWSLVHGLVAHQTLDEAVAVRVLNRARVIGIEVVPTSR